MDNRADILMLNGVVSVCPDCSAERIFVPVNDDCPDERGEFCCTTCGAAVLIGSALDPQAIRDNRRTRDTHVA